MSSARGSWVVWAMCVRMTNPGADGPALLLLHRCPNQPESAVLVWPVFMCTSICAHLFCKHFWDLCRAVLSSCGASMKNGYCCHSDNLYCKNGYENLVEVRYTVYFYHLLTVCNHNDAALYWTLCGSSGFTPLQLVVVHCLAQGHLTRLVTRFIRCRDALTSPHRSAQFSFIDLSVCQLPAG